MGYTGYGMSTGKPSMDATRADITAAYEYLTEEMKVKPEQIILYGQSLGTGLVTYLATTQRDQAFAGLILHSPLASAVRVLPHGRDVPKTPWYDIYPNVDLIKKVTCPVWIIHGAEPMRFRCITPR